MRRGLDQRSPEAQQYRQLYKTGRWQRRRKEQLSRQPLCERHLKRGDVVEATVAHHKVKHNGDPKLFWEGELESLCSPCHDSEAQSEERLGYVKGVDVSGRPLAADHPWNR